MDDIGIRVDCLSKLYRIGQQERYRTLRETLADGVQAAFRRVTPVFRGMPLKGGHSLTAEERYIWALKNISCEVKQGEVLGIIGPNGAGKTTLLKILSRITEPTDGFAQIRGRVGSLLEVGAGFHPELSGRENIYLNGAILGMKRAEMDRKLDEIVEFAGVSRFIDIPVKRYSSGMHARLAFAVAAHLDPEILIVDEVLAVGDAAFQKKCLGRMSRVAGGGRTVLFVSHNMAAIGQLCTQAIWLARGEIQARGAPDDIIDAYLAPSVEPAPTRDQLLSVTEDRFGSGRVRITKFKARDLCNGNQLLTPGGKAEFIVGYELMDDSDLIEALHLSMSVRNVQGSTIFTCSTIGYDFRNAPPKGEIECLIDDLPLLPGEYWVTFRLKEHLTGLADHLVDAVTFTVGDLDPTISLWWVPTESGSVLVRHRWGLRNV